MANLWYRLVCVARFAALGGLCLSCTTGTNSLSKGNSGSGGAGGAVVNVGGNGGGVNVGGQTAVGPLVIAPVDPVMDVTVENGMVTSTTLVGGAATPLTFSATVEGAPVMPTWSIERGELGSMDAASGVFTPSGKFSGVGTISAVYGAAVASTSVTVNLHVVQNGGAWDPATVMDGPGGIGGVGGEPPGGPVDDATKMRLTGAAQMPATAQEFGLIYPYNGTVFPRAILAPLVQWQTSHAATAVYIHLTQNNFEFQGFYSGTSLIREHIDQVAWKAATNGNGGDPLHLEVTIADATSAYGPVAEDFTIASGPLKGTVYYNSYNTTLANIAADQPQAAAIIAIRPGRSDPELALPDAIDKCIVCHNVSDDGSTMFAILGQGGSNYADGSSYDLRNGSAVIQTYTGNAPDGSTNADKFLWSGLSGDGTYALQSAGHTQEQYGGWNGTEVSGIFRRDNGNAEVATGFDGVISEAVTPAFSRDGKQVAFNYWTGSAAPGGGNGHTLDIMDFTCGAPMSAMPGAPSCASFEFSNLTRLYTNADQQHGYVGWPAWLPDSTAIVFQNQIFAPNDYHVTPLTTWKNARAKLWIVRADGSGAAMPLHALNGDDAAGQNILPNPGSAPTHDNDDALNFEPTVNPIVSGGYAWVVFTARRRYGNVASGDAYDMGDGSYAVTKKLWVAAIDLNPEPGKDPSHPAFYLPAQELVAPNMRGFWVVDPCKDKGQGCETGDECCTGFCRAAADSTELVCSEPPMGCYNEFEKCVEDDDCCNASAAGGDYHCINGRCARPPPR